MAKYSYEFKKKIVEAYLNGEGCYEYLADKYHISSFNNIKNKHDADIMMLAFVKRGSRDIS